MSHPLDRLHEIYASLPRLDCKKLCHHVCGPVFWSEIEDREIMGATGGLRLQVHPLTLACPYLTDKKLCAIYEKRPLLCRLYGMVDDPKMRCPHGCVPEFWLSNAEAKLLMHEVEQLKPLKFFGETNGTKTQKQEEQ